MTRIRENEDGTLDEFVSTNVESVHFEAMNTNQWWVGVQLDDGRYFHIRCGAKNTRAAAYCFIEEETP